MAIFDRIRRSKQQTRGVVDEPEPVAAHLLPEINQRVTVATGEHVPVPSRVEDHLGGMLELAFPSVPLEFGDEVVLTWERDEMWFTLETRVLAVDEHAPVPTVRVGTAGRFSRHGEGRADGPRTAALPIELRIVRARALRAGRELTTHTVQVGRDSLTFATTAPFAPGDVIEARIELGEATRDVVSARVRIVRVDALPGSWRSTCTATFDEILRSDRARLLAVADARAAQERAQGQAAATTGGLSAAAPPTLDGVGGRDEPQQLSTLESVVEWLRRDQPER